MNRRTYSNIGKSLCSNEIRIFGHFVYGIVAECLLAYCTKTADISRSCITMGLTYYFEVIV